MNLNRVVNSSTRLRSPKRSKKKKKKRAEVTTRPTVVNFDSTGIPVELLGGGEHFEGCPPRRLEVNDENHPMDDMIRIIQRENLIRPTVK